MNIFNKIRQTIDRWLNGLTYFCPSSLRRSIGLTPDNIMIEFRGEQIEFKHYSVDSIEPIEIHRFNKNDDLQSLSAIQWLDNLVQQNAKTILVVPDNVTLKKSLSFPAAAKSNLREALGFELNRRTPFSVEQTYYDYEITKHDKQTEKLNVELYVVPKNNLSSTLALLNEWNITIDILKPVNEYPNENNINMLPPEEKTGNNNNIDAITALLAITGFALFLTFLFVPLTQQNKQIELLEEQIQTNRKVAVQLQKLKNEKQEILAQSNFLENKYKNNLSSVQLLYELTKIIPDDTWLTRMTIKNNEIQLQGESANASSLIQIIESSNIFSQAQFRSPVTNNNTSKKDKFHLSAKLNREANI